MKRIVSLFLLAAWIGCAAEPNTKPRYIQYREADDIPSIYTSTTFTTEVMFPKKEDIKIVTGAAICDAALTQDQCKGYFAAGYQGHVVYIKYIGSVTGMHTDLRVLCASGNEYSFIVREVSKSSEFRSDLKVFVSNGDSDSQQAMLAIPKLYTDVDVAAITKQRDDAQEALKLEQARQSKVAAQAVQDEVSKIHNSYTMYEHKGDNFRASGFNDGKFTLIDVDAQEVPSLFEIKDGKESLIQEQFANGRYTVPKVLDQFELKVGKSYAKFRRAS